MIDDHRQEPDLSREERDFVDRLNARFAPPPLTAARRAALDERVRQRIETPRWNAVWAPVWVAASVAALTIVWIGLPADEKSPDSAPTVVLAHVTTPDTWTQRVLFGDPSDVTLEESEGDLPLPPEYAAIDSLFF